MPLADNCDDYRLSIEHYHYLLDKMLWKIRYSKLKYASEGENYKQGILEYESAIKKVIPDARLWDESYWYNERHIYDALTELYGVDYSDDFVEYGRILLLLMKHNAGELIYARAEAWFASNIKRMPMSLAKVIWPDNTEDKITEMFLWAAEEAEIQAASNDQATFSAREAQEMHPVGVFEYRTLRTSWLFEPVYAKYSGYHGEDEALNDIKQKVFNVAMIN